MDNQVITLIDRAIDSTGAIVAGIAPADWQLDSPCEGWTLRDVVSHLVGGIEIFAGQLNGAPITREHDEDWLLDDAAGAWAHAAAADRAAWHQPDALAATVTISLGALPGELAAWVHLTELVVHGIDVAVATGQASLVDEELARTLHAAMEVMGFEAFRLPGSFGRAVAVDDDAAPHLRLLAHLGRDVRSLAPALR